MSSVSPTLRATGLSALAIGSVLALSGCGAITSLLGGQGNVFDLSVGECFTATELNNAFASEEVSELPIVDCSEEHDSEIYYIEDLPEGDYPGDEFVSTEWEEICLGDNFTDFIGVPWEESEIDASALMPTQETWEQLDDREITCYATSSGEMLTGSLSGANR
ncbi:septum formation family protein [Nocardiopsis sp. NPDC058631]|uniref:septum formation family protein n=1 Tax=Nocardiopsis sp. NPDC058631 TaxID=3346566 RepID=UPI003662F813